MDMPPGTQMRRGSEEGMPMNMMIKMQMSLYWGEHATILFSGWPNGSVGMYFLALCIVFFLAVGVEVCAILTSSVTRAGSATHSVSYRYGLIKSLIYVFQMSLAYLVMLSVMSFNGGIFIVVVVGHGIGHFIAKNLTQMLMKGDVLAARTADGNA